VLCIGDTLVRLETNDPDIAGAIQNLTACCETMNDEGASHWRLIRDEQAPCGGRALSVFSGGPIAILLFGCGTVIAVDRERREVLGFVAADLSAEECATIVLPLVLYLLRMPQENATPMNSLGNPGAMRQNVS
jgi:hypothetical protein